MSRRPPRPWESRVQQGVQYHGAGLVDGRVVPSAAPVVRDALRIPVHSAEPEGLRCAVGSVPTSVAVGAYAGDTPDGIEYTITWDPAPGSSGSSGEYGAYQVQLAPFAITGSSAYLYITLETPNSSVPLTIPPGVVWNALDANTYTMSGTGDVGMGVVLGWIYESSQQTLAQRTPTILTVQSRYTFDWGLVCLSGSVGG